RYERPEERLALSNEALKINGTPTRAVMSTSCPAISATWASLSMTHGPAMSAKGRPSPTKMLRNMTAATAHASYSVAAGLATRGALRREAAVTDAESRGCGGVGFDVKSGWNWTARYQAWLGSSAVATHLPPGARPEIFRRCSVSLRSPRIMNSSPWPKLT